MLSEVANRCKINRSLPCYHDTCHLDNRKFLDIIEEYLSTDTLRSASTEPDTISFKHDSKEIMMIRRSDIAICVNEPDIMIHYFRTGKISRRVCDVFQKAGEAFSVRWAEYRTGAI